MLTVSNVLLPVLQFPMQVSAGFSDASAAALLLNPFLALGAAAAAPRSSGPVRMQAQPQLPKPSRAAAAAAGDQQDAVAAGETPRAAAAAAAAAALLQQGLLDNSKHSSSRSSFTLPSRGAPPGVPLPPTSATAMGGAVDGPREKQAEQQQDGEQADGEGGRRVPASLTQQPKHQQQHQRWEDGSVTSPGDLSAAAAAAAAAMGMGGAAGLVNWAGWPLGALWMGSAAGYLPQGLPGRHHHHHHHQHHHHHKQQQHEAWEARQGGGSGGEGDSNEGVGEDEQGGKPTPGNQQGSSRQPLATGAGGGGDSDRGPLAPSSHKRMRGAEHQQQQQGKEQGGRGDGAAARTGNGGAPAAKRREREGGDEGVSKETMHVEEQQGMDEIMGEAEGPDPNDSHQQQQEHGGAAAGASLGGQISSKRKKHSSGTARVGKPPLPTQPSSGVAAAGSAGKGGRGGTGEEVEGRGTSGGGSQQQWQHQQQQQQLFEQQQVAATAAAGGGGGTGGASMTAAGLLVAAALAGACQGRPGHLGHLTHPMGHPGEKTVTERTRTTITAAGDGGASSGAGTDTGGSGTRPEAVGVTGVTAGDTSRRPRVTDAAAAAMPAAGVVFSMPEGGGNAVGVKDCAVVDVDMVEDGTLAAKSSTKHGERGNRQQRVRMVWSGELHTRYVTY